MLSRQRSSCFLLDPPRPRGAEFVETLRLIGYPGADALQGQDFDWLCEDSGGEAELFVGWFCGAVGQQNVLSAEQLDAYQNLLASGQPLLEADELQSVSVAGRAGEEEEDGAGVAELEAEVQSLQSLRLQLLRCRNKLQSRGVALGRCRQALQAWEGEQERGLHDTKEESAGLNSRSNRAWAQLRETAAGLGELHGAPGGGGVFLSRLGLEAYMGLEEASWGPVQEWARGTLPTEVEREGRARREMEKEGGRVRTVWTSQMVQLSRARATLCGQEEALSWAGGRGGEQMWDPLWFQALEREIQTLEGEVETLQAQRLPALAWESSVGTCLPAHRGWLQAEERRLGQAERGQALAGEALLGQLARVQLLELGLQVERRDLQQTEGRLRELGAELGYRAGELERRVSGPWVSSQRLTPIRIDSRDHTALRLSAMLDDPANQKELFPKYEALQRRGASLLQEVTSLSGKRQGPLPQVGGLEQECDDLHRGVCHGTRRLQLREPSLTLSLEAVTSAASQLNQWLLDFLRDLKCKRAALQNSRLGQERQLYVSFYQDPALLAKVVEDLERRVREIHFE
ncbi:HAUS augmin-like complex subunit 3 [Ascaphus truei]|uniref:HAUS augmin-like complex subunit 3 n=1 Tax=Ascaphus truei TaxID=8439 RepID=UPI003F59F553